MVDGGQLVALLVVDGGRDLLGVGLHTVQYSTVQYSTVQYSAVQYSTVEYSTTQVNTLLHYRKWRFAFE